MKMRTLMILTGAAAMLAAQGVGAQQTDPEAAVQAVRAADEALNRAVTTRDRELFESLIAEDATFLSAGLLQGRDAIVAAWSVFFAADRTTILSWRPHTVEVAASGDLAYTIGDFELRSSETEGDGQLSTGTYVTIWKSFPDGTWKAVVDAGTPPESTE